MSLAQAKLLNAFSLVKTNSVVLDMVVKSRERGIDIGSAYSELGLNWEMLMERSALGAIERTNQMRFWDSVVGWIKTLSRSRTLIVQVFRKARQDFVQVESRWKVLKLSLSSEAARRAAVDLL
jgi:hypothetical protein